MAAKFHARIVYNKNTNEHHINIINSNRNQEVLSTTETFKRRAGLFKNLKAQLNGFGGSSIQVRERIKGTDGDLIYQFYADGMFSWKINGPKFNSDPASVIGGSKSKK